MPAASAERLDILIAVVDKNSAVMGEPVFMQRKDTISVVATKEIA